MRLTEVITGVYQLPLFRTSAFLIMDEQITIVDAGWRGCGGTVLRAVKALGRHPEEVRYIISTHYHPDHVGGMASLKKRSGGQVAAHETEAAALGGSTPYPRRSPVRPLALRWLLAPVFAALQPPAFPVDVPLGSGQVLDVLGGMEVVHTPGHTPGSISLLFPRQGLLLAGDALQYRRGRLLPPSPWFSEDMKQGEESVRKLAGLEFETLGLSHFPAIRGGGSKMLRELADSLE